MRVGADTGGTFSDLVDGDGNVVKVPSDRGAPDRAIARGLDELTGGGARPASLAHGTTVATNAVLEGKLAAVALVTDAGLEDVIEIGRQDRPSLYDQRADRPAVLVPRSRRFGLAVRRDAEGEVLTPIPVDALDNVAERLHAEYPDSPVAVVLLHADLTVDDEATVATALRSHGFDVVASHEISPEFREYERTVTTVVNAGLRPACGPYLRRLDDLADDVSVMTSAGGLLDVDVAADRPAALLLSGPAGGVRAAAAVADACGFPGAVTLDMGGTSTDLALVQHGRPSMATTRHVGGQPVRFPSVDIHTIGAGGGSLARIDAGGALTVGPESAGADPGPACYGHGGTEPTVTDANVVAGRIPTGAEFGGLRLDADAARAALDRAGIAAADVLRVVDANMERAIRTVSVERGVDPTDLALVAFGGAGALHACALADALGMPAVVVPPRAGVLSAVGLLTAPRRREVVRSRRRPADLSDLDATVAEVAARAVDAGGADAAIEIGFDCRYAGQSHELTVASIDDFADAHRARNGFDRPDAAIEVVAVRAAAVGAAELDVADLPVPAHRERFVPVDGPGVIAEPDATIWVADGWRAERGALGSLVLRRISP